MTIQQQIEDRLQDAFRPQELKVENESEHHRGHAGWDGSGESHFRIVLCSERFNGLTRVQRHRLVYQALSPEPMNHIHALQMELTGTR
ncbi:MAG: BolA family transcriptional regulator [Rhodobacteraceae bacterium]|nr:BolA family transcriptional regulator [Paracoccaceae bacterium]MCY4197609.1 BolA family transcriptional regulator [Paracoccaceae bacterium]MCY4327611.1 BolA family transcriptional regulator [Paracoccaceae bacterium]